MEDQRSDLQRVLDAIDDLEPHVPLERSAQARRRAALVRTSRSPRSSATRRLIDVEPGDTTGTRYAIAFDLGTTTVVATLLDLETGQPLAVRSMLNPQQPFGGDVITRISATMMDPGALDTPALARARDDGRAHRRGVRGGGRRARARSTRSPSAATRR